jgi:c-di-GMP-related signal transduction protein
MLRLPMEELTPTLPLRNEIRMALEGAKVPEGVLLAWLESHEYADWDACGSIARAGRLDEDKLLGCYAEAVVWAESALHLF